MTEAEETTETTAETTAQTAAETAPETTAETQPENKTEEKAETLDFVDIEAELSPLKEEKQYYEKAAEASEIHSEKKPEAATQPEADTKDKLKEEKKASDETLEAGAEMLFNVTDFTLSSLNAWLNKEPEKQEDYEADRKGKNLIITNLVTYFKALGITFTPGQGIFYSYIVVYGFDFLAGIFLRIKDFVKSLMEKRKKVMERFSRPAPANGNNGQQQPPPPPEPETPESLMLKARRLKEEAYEREKMHPCENPECNKDEGFNQWVPRDKKYCGGSCRTTHQNALRKAKA